MSQPPQGPPPPGWGTPYPPPQPGFGYPVPPPRKSRTGLIIFLSILGGFVFLCGGCGLLAAVGILDSAVSVKSSPPPDVVVSGEPAAPASPSAGKPAAVGIGTPVRDGKFEFTVRSMKCGVKQIGVQYLQHRAQGRFCLVTIKVRNIGTEPQTFYDGYQWGFVGNKIYRPDGEGDFYANLGSDGNPTDVWMNEINPGNSVTGVMVWDVPAGAKLDKLELHDSAFSGGVEVTL